MSWPTIAECYDDMVKDPSLLQLFPEKEWLSIQELTLLGTLWFRIILERLFAHKASLAMKGRPEWNLSPAMTTKEVEKPSQWWFWFLSLHWPLIPIKKRAPRWREDWAFNQASSFYKMSIKPELSWDVSWSRNRRSWLEETMTGRSHWPGDMRGSDHRWLNRQMPLFKRSFPRWAWLTLLSYCLGVFPPKFPLLHEWSPGHCCATGWGHPSYHHCIWAWGLTSSRPPGSPACPPSTLQLPVPPLPDISFEGTPPVGHPFAEFLAIPTKKKWDHSPSSLLSNHHDKRMDPFWLPRGHG